MTTHSIRDSVIGKYTNDFIWGEIYGVHGQYSYTHIIMDAIEETVVDYGLGQPEFEEYRKVPNSEHIISGKANEIYISNYLCFITEK